MVWYGEWLCKKVWNEIGGSKWTCMIDKSGRDSLGKVYIWSGNLIVAWQSVKLLLSPRLVGWELRISWPWMWKWMWMWPILLGIQSLASVLGFQFSNPGFSRSPPLEKREMMIDEELYCCLFFPSDKVPCSSTFTLCSYLNVTEEWLGEIYERSARNLQFKKLISTHKRTVYCCGLER